MNSNIRVIRVRKDESIASGRRVDASELKGILVYSEMHQCTIRFISMYELTLCLEVLCVSE